MGLADRSLRSTHDRPELLLVTTTQLQAVANAFVLLDLLGEDRAEAVLAEQQAGLEALRVEPRGVQSGELTLRSATAHGFAQARRRPRALLRDEVISVAVPGSRLSFPDMEVRIEWLVLAPSGLRGQAVIAARADPQLPAIQVQVVVPAVDDTGRTYQLTVRAGQTGVTTTPPRWAGAGTARAEISTQPPLPAGTSWIEIRPADTPAQRVDLVPADRLSSGRSEPAWPTPGEWLLDRILPDVSDLGAGAVFGVGLDAAGAIAVAAAVADSLLAVGVLPAGSRLLRQLPDRQSRWQRELQDRYIARVDRELTSPTGDWSVVAVGASFPLEHAVVTLDAVIVNNGDVYLRTYNFPDGVGEYWPVNIRPFALSATDDLGLQHHAIPATYWRAHNGEGLSDWWLWPPLDPGVRRLRLEATTPWEAAWTDIDIQQA